LHAIQANKDDDELKECTFKPQTKTTV
jgi:hypothetical protein